MFFVVFFILLWAPLSSTSFFPTEWVRQDLNLAQFFISFGEPQQKIATLREILETGCLRGDLKLILWALRKQKEAQLYHPSLDMSTALEKMVLGGFDSVLLQMPRIIDFLGIDEQKRARLIDRALEVGYPSTVATLQNLGFSLLPAQEKKLETLKQHLKEESNALAPPPINALHHSAHGGDENFALYQREYSLCVSYALFHMRKSPCDFRTLIENLGHRRRRMAALGKLSGVESYGMPTDQLMVTYYHPTYAAYGQKIHEKHFFLPFIVIATLNGKKVYLTQCNDDSWIHPDGEHREEVLSAVACLCQDILNREYPQEKAGELAYDLGKIIWWFSHAPPFLRGTPTIISILTDAFWIYHKHTPLSKSVDVNCEALTYDNEEEFSRYMYHLALLPCAFCS